MILVIIFFAILIYGAFYFLGRAICKKNNFLKKNANKSNSIILSVALIPIVMTVDREVLAYGFGYSLSPVIGAIITHFLVISLFKKKKKKKMSFFNEEYYFGFAGIMLLSYIALLFPST
tara:strand:+ start:69 stop:425 length:357 start_codon:yes stop_codon:yes gene_type:complete